MKQDTITDRCVIRLAPKACIGVDLIPCQPGVVGFGTSRVRACRVYAQNIKWQELFAIVPLKFGNGYCVVSPYIPYHGQQQTAAIRIAARSSLRETTKS